MSVRGQSVAIIGTGFAGLGMAATLRRAGHDDFVLFEAADDVGGCWRENTYPGAACDVPSHLYSFSFAPSATWSRRFAPQPEILDYLRSIADTFALRPHIRFRSRVAAATFDDTSASWTVRLDDGTETVHDVVVFACGQLSNPVIPAIEGAESFRGNLFHSARWDHDADLTGARVAVIGTGASAIQFVPRLAEQVGHLTLLQRSAPFVIPKADYAYPRWARSMFARVPALQRLSRWLTWATLEPRSIGFTKIPALLKIVGLRSRLHMRRQITDPATRAAVTPDHPIGCKRILISNDYLASLDRPNVTVTTTGIDRITPDGVRLANGSTVEADTIVYGTGFHATDFLRGITVTGAEGRDLHREWDDGAQAHLGVSVHGFPNMFLLYGPNTNLGHTSIILMLEAQMKYVVQAVEHLDAGRARAVQVRADVERRSNLALQSALSKTVWEQGCTSWYRTASGRNTNNWPASTAHYIRVMRSLDESEFEWTPTDRSA
ncbi:NAD(P)/FAD-dependent oxidoreductase [Williamsia herbipolensis]|uniref:NAD(P)/FAD-dependent oxidoreductase n=1 Tax=Williamsia herbipolensis TaxID=1603258 RepID=A0AAU4JXT2_9NOCA|nr:NAD(P)/FAD-dependent oxidoreductase [Williamsia herbipolensis]